MPERVVALDDPRLALYRAVGDAELARAHNVFVAEGRLVVRRVLESGRFLVRSVLVNEAAERDLSASLARLDSSIPVLSCRTEDFTHITGFNMHRGCLALVERPPESAVTDIIADAVRVVVLDGITNADNVGGVFRNAAAFGADAVVLSPDGCDPLYRKAIRTSMAAVLAVPFARSRDWPTDVQQVRDAGFTLVALTPGEGAEPLDAFARRAEGLRLALVLGAEGSGVTPAVASVADVAVRIPMRRSVDSLNVVVAAGIAMHRLFAIRS